MHTHAAAAVFDPDKFSNHHGTVSHRFVKLARFRPGYPCYSRAIVRVKYPWCTCGKSFRSPERISVCTNSDGKPTREWPEIAAELSKETDPRKIVRLTEELGQALAEQDPLWKPTTPAE